MTIDAGLVSIQAPEKRQKARPHPAGFVHLAVAMAILIVVVLTALFSTTNAPPAIAEFAPQAHQPIKQAPPDQNSISGAVQGTGPGAGGSGGIGPGGSGGGGGGGGPGIPKNGVTYLPCVGNPPRQIADPQSPPCVTGWQGDNGGATSKGVTGSTITIAWVCQCSPGQESTNAVDAEAPALQKFFNSHFELYHRQINLVEQYGNFADTASEQALANSVATGTSAVPPAFATTQFTNQGGLAYSEQAARDHVVAGMGFEVNPSEANLQGFAPYLWSYEMTSNNMLTELGDWYCTRLNGQNATHAGVGLSTKPRKLGVLYSPWNYALGTDLTPLSTALRQCGVTPDIFKDSANNPYSTATAAQFQSNGDTSVVCLCYFSYWQTFTTSAASQGYFPEWLLSSFGGSDTNWAFHGNGEANPQEAQQAFGLSFEPKQESLANDPMWWAWQGGDPTASGPVTNNDVYQGHLLYRSLLEIMSGIQMAGPDLTPESFQKGLQAAAFPNPDTSIYAGHVGFNGGSHAMTVDAAEWWWSNAATSPWSYAGDEPGAMCYVNKGERHTADDWIGDAGQFFTPSCDTGG